MRIASVDEQPGARIPGKHFPVQVLGLPGFAFLCGAAVHVVGHDLEAQLDRRAHDLAVRGLVQVFAADGFGRVPPVHQAGVLVEQCLRREIVESERAQTWQQGQCKLPGVGVVMCLVDQDDAAVGRLLGDDVGGVGGFPLFRLGDGRVRRHVTLQREVAKRLVVKAQFVLDRRKHLHGERPVGDGKRLHRLDQVNVAGKVIGLLPQPVEHFYGGRAEILSRCGREKRRDHAERDGNRSKWHADRHVQPPWMTRG